MNLTSDLRGDSNPYTPLPAHSMASHSTITTTPIHHNTTAPHQTSRPQPTGLANTPAAQQPIWPTPSPRFHKPLPSQHTPTSASTPSSAQKPPKPSVKHLTCYFWSEFGHCQWSSADCLYAHAYTGKVASAPVQVEVGSKFSSCRVKGPTFNSSFPFLPFPFLSFFSFFFFSFFNTIALFVFSFLCVWDIYTCEYIYGWVREVNLN